MSAPLCAAAEPTGGGRSRVIADLGEAIADRAACFIVHRIQADTLRVIHGKQGRRAKGKLPLDFTW